MKASYSIVESENIAKEKELLEKIYRLIEWKTTAEENLKIMLKELKNSVSGEDHN